MVDKIVTAVTAAPGTSFAASPPATMRTPYTDNGEGITIVKPSTAPPRSGTVTMGVFKAGGIEGDTVT